MFMKAIQGNLIHLVQNGEFDLIVHGCNWICTMGAGIAKEIKSAFRGLCRPFRAWNPVGDGTQGVALGCRMVPRWGAKMERELTRFRVSKVSNHCQRLERRDAYE